MLVVAKLHTSKGGSASWGRPGDELIEATVDEYDPVRDVWISAPNMEARRSTLGVAMLNDRIYAVVSRPIGLFSNCPK